MPLSRSDTDSVYDPALRRIHWAGLVCLATWLTGLMALGRLAPEPYRHFWQLIGVQLAAGRPGALFLGLSMGFSRWYLWVHCSMQGVLILLLLYPPLVAGYRRTVERSSTGFFGRLRTAGRERLGRIRAGAERRLHWVEPYGGVGIFLFVLAPVYGTGPLPGCFIGYLLGLRIRLAVSAAVAGHFAGTGLYILFFDHISRFAALAGTTPVIVGTLVIATVLGFHMRRKRKEAAASNGVDTGDAEPNQKA